MMTTTPTERERYRALHEENPHYQSNNWLLDEWEFLESRLAPGIVEVGCGNGRFLLRAAESLEDVTGIDWVCAPLIREAVERGAGFRFVEADIVTDAIDVRAHCVLSADVLEHIAPESLDVAMAKIHAIAPRAFHKIACYPAQWTHPSVFTPEEWLGRFRKLDPAYRLLKVEQRRNREDQPVATIVLGDWD